MNEEVKISLTANVKPFRESMKQAIKDIDVATLHMEGFDSLIESASGKDLKNIATNLKNSIKEQKAVIKDLQLQYLDGIFTKQPIYSLEETAKSIKQNKADLADMQKRLAMVGGNTLTPLQKAFGKVRGAINALHKPITQFGKLFGRMIYFSVIFKGIMLIQNGLRNATELSSVATNNFTAMGNVIAGVLIPVVEWFANAVRKALVWVAGLIKYLTGFNILAKGIDATNKKISKLGKNAKKSGKDVKEGLLSGLDEINNISQDTGAGSSSGGDDITAQLGAIGSLKDMMKEMSSLDFSWAKPFKVVLDFIVENWDWLKVLLLGLVVALGTFVVAMALTNAVIAINNGLLLASPITWYVALIAVLIGAIIACIVYWDEFKLMIENFAKKAGEAINNFVTSVKQWFSNLWTNIKTIFAPVDQWFKTKVENIASFFQTLPTTISNVVNSMWNKITSVFSGIGAWFGARITDIVNGFKSLPNKVMTFFNNLWTNIKNLFADVGQIVGTAISSAVKKAVNSVLSTAVSLINGFLKAINGAITIINAIPGVNIKKLDMLKVPSFDVGTNYVPQDMIAQIHKGERIVPAKYNHEDWTGDGTDMSETNSLLEQLISVVANKNLTIGRDAIGKASVDYIKAERRRRGELII